MPSDFDDEQLALLDQRGDLARAAKRVVEHARDLYLWPDRGLVGGYRAVWAW